MNSNKLSSTKLSSIVVDLTTQTLMLYRVGDVKEGPFNVSTGKGNGCNCDDFDTSQKSGSNCTPKGKFMTVARAEHLPQYEEAKWAVYFELNRGIAFHYYPIVPRYPASHGCVRIEELAVAKSIYDTCILYSENSTPTQVIVDGIWKQPYKIDVINLFSHDGV